MTKETNLSSSASASSITESSSVKRQPTSQKKSLSVGNLSSVSSSHIDLSSRHIESIDSPSPFRKGVPFKNSLVDKIAASFSKIVRWLLRRPDPLNIKWLELSFAMELYRSSDDLLLELSKNGDRVSASLSFSNVLKLWSQFLKKSHEQEAIGWGEKLGKSVSIQTSLEKINQLPEHKQLKEYNALRDKVLKHLRQLKEGETLLIPSGFIQDNQRHPILCEFTKTKEGYEFRATGVGEHEQPTDDDSSVKPSRKSSFEAKDSFEDDDVNNVLTAILACPIHWKGSLGDEKLQKLADDVRNNISPPLSFSKIFRLIRVSGLSGFKQLAKLVFSEEARANFSIEDFVENLASKDVRIHSSEALNAFFDLSGKLEEPASVEKTIEVFLKTKNDVLGHRLKLSYKIGLLEDIFYRTRKQLHRYPDLRRELQHEMESLYATIDDYEEVHQKIILDPYRSVLKSILEQIRKTDGGDRLLPQAPEKQKGVKNIFNTLVRLPVKTTYLSQFSSIKPSGAAVSSFATPRLVNNEPEAILEYLKQAQIDCQKLIAKKEYQVLDAFLLDIAQAIEDLDLTTLLEGDEPEVAEQTRETLEFLFFNVAHAHTKLHKEGLSAITLYQLGVFVEKLDPKDASVLQIDLFEHPYFDLGSFGNNAFREKVQHLFQRPISHAGQATPGVFENIKNFNIKELKKCTLHECLAALFDHYRTSLQHNGPVIKDREVAQRMIERRVVDDASSVQLKEDVVDLMPVTAHAIHDEKFCFEGLPMDVSAELQLITSSADKKPKSLASLNMPGHLLNQAHHFGHPLGSGQVPPLNSVKFALGAFSKIAGLFGHEKVGLDWQRVFSIILFQNARLNELIEQEPEYALVYLETLRGMIEDAHASDNIKASLYLMRIYRESMPIIENLLLQIDRDEIEIDDELKAKISSVLPEYHRHLQDDLFLISLWKDRADGDAASLDANQVVTNALRNRGLIHEQFLYHTALNYPLADNHSLKVNFNDDVLKQIHQSSFILEQIGSQRGARSLDETKLINHLIWKSTPQIQAFFQAATSDEIVVYLKPLIIQDQQDETLEGSYPLYSLGQYQIDVQKNILYLDGQAKRLIPSKIASHPACIRIFGETGLYSIYSKYQNVTYKLNDESHPAEEFAFSFNGHKYRIISNVSDEVFVYKQIQLPGQKKTFWFQYQSLDFNLPEEYRAPRRHLPSEVENGLVWLHQKGQFALAEAPEKEEAYFLKLNKNHSWTKNSNDLRLVTSVQLVTNKGHRKVLNPWRLPSFKIFQALDSYAHLIATGKKNVEKIAYDRLNLTYQWDRDQKVWRAGQYPGYTLSNRKIDSVLNLSSLTPEDDLKERESVSLFTSNFYHYQILEHETKLPKLLLTACRYERSLDENAYKALPQFEEETTSSLFVYEVDPHIGLKCQSASGYLYLSYVLLTQKRYTEALAYLRKADSLEIHQDEQFTTILGWLRAWEDSSSEALAFNLQLECQLFDWQCVNDPHAFSSSEHQGFLADLDELVKRYEDEVDLIPSVLRLSQQQKSTLEAFFKANLFQAHENVVRFIKTYPEFEEFYHQLSSKKGIKDDIDNDVLELYEELKNLLSQNKIYFEELKAYLVANLDEGVDWNDDQQFSKLLEIEKLHRFNLRRMLASEMEKMEELHDSYQDRARSHDVIPFAKNIFPDDFLAHYLNEAPASTGQVEQKVDTFRRVFQGADEYLEEKGDELADDIEAAVKDLDSLKVLKKSFDPSQLAKDVREGNPDLGLPGYEKLKDEANQHRAEIIKLFKLSNVELDDDWHRLQFKIEQRENTLGHYFNLARFCYASDDFSPLIDEKIINDDAVDELKDQLRKFLEKDSQRQQYFRALEKAKQIQKGGDIDILGPQLIQILTQQRAYDVENDPDSPLLAVFEWECGYVATPAQINNFKQILTEDNLFKQEALAGGKTTVIRNIITKFKADGYSLAGVVTHIPLMEMHHPLFERAAREAYGENVFTFSFSRQSPTDVVSLSHLLFNLKKMIVEKGRVDLSKRDLLSLHHSILLKWEQLSRAAIDQGIRPDARHPSEDESIQQEIDVCSEIISLLQNHLRLGSDELDTITNCEEEHIFAYGGKTPLNPDKIDVALQIMEWILTKNRLKTEKSIFINNQQCKFTPKEREHFIEKLAKLVHAKIAKDLDKQELVKYLTKPLKQGETAEFYQEHILNHANGKKLQVFKKYFQDIVTESTLRKQGGVRFGRSEDGWLVKPYESSDVCMENSQQSSEEETIWFTICNYMNYEPFENTILGGVRAEQIAELVQTKQAEAAKEVKNARRLGRILPYEKTKAAKEWGKRFSIPLVKVLPEQYEQIAQEINNDARLLRQFLRYYVIPKNFSSPLKIGANANDLAEMVLEFYGSSGTSELAPTFPEKVVLKEELVRQEGVNGRVLWTLMKTFKEGDILFSSNVVETLSTEMKEGDALIDLAPAFPGLSGKKIAQKVGSALQKEGKLSQDGIIRYLDRSNEPRFLDLSTGQDQAMPSNPDTKRTTNILSQKDARGTNFEMADDSIGYLTIGTNTTLTNFLQAVLRMRKLPERLLSDSEKGQRIRYILDDAVKATLGDHPTLEDLLAFVAKNEVEELKKLRFKAEKQKIEAIPRCDLFSTISKVTDYEARRMIWPQVRPFFFQPSQATIEAGGIPNQLIPPLDILKGVAGKNKNQIITIQQLFTGILDDPDSELSEQTIEALNSFISELDTIIDKLELKESGEGLPEAKYFLDLMSTTATELDLHQTAEQEQDLEAEQEQQLQQQNVAIQGKAVTKPRPKLPLRNPGYLCDHLYQVRSDDRYVNPSGPFQSLKKVVPYMDDYTYYTRGAYPNFMDDEDPWSNLDPAKAGQILIPRVLVMVDKRFDPPRVVSLIGTRNDFNDIDEFARKHKDNDEIDIYISNIRNDHLDGGRYEWADAYSEEVERIIARRLVQMKFFNGEIDLLKPPRSEHSPMRHEYSAFEEWLRDMIQKGITRADSLEGSFLDYLQAYRPSQIPQYHTSAVAKIFKKLKREAGQVT
ncbi:MAG: hypothetical protein ACSNEK_00320 [Parachlamydiaceae bacterium]